MNITTKQICPQCKGKGKLPDYFGAPGDTCDCPYCKGGIIKEDESNPDVTPDATEAPERDEDTISLTDTLPEHGGFWYGYCNGCGYKKSIREAGHCIACQPL